MRFGTDLEVLLRDRFVLGFNLGTERDRLFEHDCNTWTLAKAIEVAQQAACASQVHVHVVKEEPVYRVRGTRAAAVALTPGPAGTTTSEQRDAQCVD